MSRYRPDPRLSGDLAYRDPPPQRWDTDRFREYQRFEQRPAYDDAYRSPPRARAPVMEESRYYEEDRQGPRGARQRQYYEEDDYYRDDPRAAQGALIPMRPERPARPGQLLRRQSSLDTFDRRRPHDDYYARPPPGRLPDYEGVSVQDPERYGNDGFREYREKEWVTSRRRNSRSRSRSRTRTEFIDDEIREEKTYPRKGKTRMPKRLISTRVLYDLGYPYYEEDEKTILIEKALGPHNIDEIFTLSKQYRERETTTTRLLEAPLDIHEPGVIVEKETIIDSKVVPISEAPRSVREWDALSVRSPSPSRTHRSRSRRAKSRRGSSPTTVKEVIIEKKITERDISPARTHRGSVRDLSPARSAVSHGSEVIVEKRIYEEADFDESNSVHVGPLALVVDRKQSRSDRDIKEEIRRLESERRQLRKERRYDREGSELIKVERVRERSPSPRGEVIVERRGEEVMEVKKDRRGRSRSAAPSPALIKAMFATLT